jgi:hypothetical protein
MSVCRYITDFRRDNKELYIIQNRKLLVLIKVSKFIVTLVATRDDSLKLYNPMLGIHITTESPMTQRQPLLISLMLLICVVLPACGTTGKTSPFVLTLSLPQGQNIVSNIRIASVAMVSDAAILNAVGNVQPWGKFEPDDLRNIEQSMRDTIRLQFSAMISSTGHMLDVHLIIRHYMVSVSNTGGAVLACVTWAATESDGKLIYHEQFYASEAAYLFGTIGLLKESVHKAIVRRIATISFALASSSIAENARPTTFDNTYASLEEATSQLPQYMVSMGSPLLLPFPDVAISAVGLLIPSGISTVQWNVTKPSQDFDWQGYLEKLYMSR